MSENVIYRKLSTDSYEYYSMPASCVGRGSSVAEARANYRSALAFALDVDEVDLPAIAEHVEVEADHGQVWIRIALDADQENRVIGLNIMKRLVEDMKPADLTTLSHVTTAAGDSVIIVAQPSDTLGFVFDQMSVFDALWIVMLRASSKVEWVALFGGHADGIRPDEMEAYERTGPTRDMTISELFASAVSEHPEKARQLLLPA